MIDVKESNIEMKLQQAVDQAASRRTGQLVSITHKIDSVDPIHFFETAKLLNKDRIFWSNAVDDFYLVGIGQATEIEPSQSRLDSIETKWQNMLRESIVHNPYALPGTGLIALGGMSFDPKKKRSRLWGNYSVSHFTIPEYLLTKVEGACYFTTTVIVDSKTDVSQLMHMVHEDKHQLLNTAITLPDASYVTHKEEVEPEQWMETVKKAITALNNNEAKKIVLAREMRLKLNDRAEISPMLEKLLHMQTNSYVFAFEKKGDCFIGATPERLVRVDGDQLLSTSLAGTAPRGKTETEDKQIAADLFNDSKNRHEHDYVVQMIKQSIQNYCTHIDIPEEPFVYPLKNLYHLYTPVHAVLKTGYTILDIVQQLHPTPALGGEPREASLAFIRDHELLDRGWYGAPIGWLDSNNHGEFAVAIRSGLIQQDEVSLFAGCGVMQDSDPVEEYAETNIKFLPMLSVMEDQHGSY